MSSEELAPSSLKNRRTERQNKYFKEQVLMKEDAKIIAKTHKGESILTVDANPYQEEYIFNEVKDNVSEKASFDYQSDNEARNKELDTNGFSTQMNVTKVVRKEMKYKNLTTSMKEFYNLLEEYSLENVRRKLSDKVKGLKPSTVEEIQKMLNN
jgi:hypothetical protein